MAVNGKKKGSKNERNLCKWWQSWSGIEFTRVPASGGLRWGKTSNTTGDLIVADERASRRFPFSIEAKSYNDIRFEHLILGNKKIKVIEFWEQCKEDAVRGNKIPILFMRYNNMAASTWFVIISEDIYKIWVKNKGKNSFPLAKLILPEESLVLMNSNDITSVDYKEFIKQIKIYNRNGK
jgi:hypothetical protein